MRKFAVLYFGALGIAILLISVGFGRQSGEVNLQTVLQAPSWNFWFGTDSLGRGLFYRSIAGARVSLGVGLLAAFGAFGLGAFVGAISALMPSSVDRGLMRITEVISALPHILLLGVLGLFFQSFFLEPGILSISLTLIFGSWMSFARYTRNLFLREKSQLYVDAAVATGASPFRLILRHLLPNVMTDLLVFLTLQIPHLILAESLLSFLGLGLRPPQVSWGALMNEGWKSLGVYPHLLLIPSGVLFLTILSLHLLLEEMRVKTDPQLRWQRFSETI